MSKDVIDKKYLIDNEKIKSWPLDFCTAASLGDVSYFMKQDIEFLKSQISSPNGFGWSPIMYACSRGHSLLVKYLQKFGVNMKCKTKSGVTLPMLAIKSGDLSTVECVLEVSNLEDRDHKQWTPLFYAVHFTREKCLSYLLKRGANVNIVDYQNETPLMVAIKLGRETMVELLLKSATNLDVISFKEETALMLAKESNNTEIQSMVNAKYKILRKSEKENLSENSLPQSEDNKKSTEKDYSPSRFTQQIKTQITQLRFGKSLSYSPNTIDLNHKVAPFVGDSPWKVSIKKQFWSPQLKHQNKVEKFLKMLGLEKYWPIFRDEEVDFETLLTLNEENLKELGIHLFGPRKKIILAIQKLKAEL